MKVFISLFALHKGHEVDLNSEEFSDINIVTGVIKLYFRELQQPLLTFEKYDAFVASTKFADPSARANQIKAIVKTLPKANFETLQYLVKHLKKVARLADTNKMDASNLGIVFGPTLLRPQVETFESILNTAAHSAVIESMITNSDAIFSSK
jgi:hypothetical protein